MASLASRLKPIIPQRYPGFDCHYELGSSNAYGFAAEDCRHWHNRMWKTIHAAAGTESHFPVFRMSHGEFIMGVGYRCPSGPNRPEWVAKFMTWGLAAKRGLGLSPAFLSGSPSNSWETFTSRELGTARRIYVNSLREISRIGLLAAAFYDNAGFREYFPAYFTWLERHDVTLTPANYMSFYSIYTGFAGDELKELIAGRRLLVVTSLNQEKVARIRSALGRLGAQDVQFHAVSASKAMFDDINLAQIQGRIDVALVAAGVGSAKILCQLKPLSAVALDVGFALDCLAYPEKRWERPYCVPDAEFDLTRIGFLTNG